MVQTPNRYLDKHIELSTPNEKEGWIMEVLFRWDCPCHLRLQSCPYCKGAAYFEQWVPVDLVQYLTGGRSYAILDRRVVLTSQIGAAG